MHVLYVTKRLPFGDEETFIVPEIEQHREAGYEITICPVQCGRLIHGTGKALLSSTIAEPLISLKMCVALLRAVFSAPGKLFLVLCDLMSSRSLGILLRNLAVLPKGVWLAGQVRKLQVEHIHAHWIAVPSTMAMIASRMSGVPFSITAHRYDIGQKNLLPVKFKHAKFVRAIDRRGADELSGGVPCKDVRPVVVHLGVVFPAKAIVEARVTDEVLRIVCAAHFVEKKGHQYLLHAIANTRKAACRIEATFCGSGPLENSLKSLSESLALTDQVNWLGVVSHDGLLEKFSNGCYDVAVLPSITTSDGAKEGIPVFLMEAMAAGLPVIATPNGGITELVKPDSGIIVEERNIKQLTGALVAMANSRSMRILFGVNGRRRIADEFEVGACALKVRQLMER